MEKYKKNKCDSAFKSQERDERLQAFASKTNSPAVGKYNVRFT